MKGGSGKGIDGEEGGREDHDWMEEGRGKDERSNVTHLEGKRGRRKRGGTIGGEKAKRERRDDDWMEKRGIRKE